MNRKLFIATIVTAIYLTLFGFVAHAIVLEGMYMNMADMMRPDEAAMGLMLWIYIAYILQAIVLSAFYIDRGGADGLAGGIKFGLAAGVLIGAVNLIHYAVYPYMLGVSLTLFLTTLLQYAGAGLVLALVVPKLK